jgi:cell wall-associated NlpC family hydrolase
VSEPSQSQNQSRAFRVAKNLINLYGQPDTGSEVVTQVLLNAKLIAESEANGFLYVVGTDRYHGWADRRHLEDFQAKEDCSLATVSNLVADVFTRPELNSELSTKLVLSTQVELATDAETTDALQAIYLPDSMHTAENQSIRHSINESKHGWIRKSDLCCFVPKTLSNWDTASSDTRKLIIKKLGQNVLKLAERFIGVPYLWGGCSPFGIDCSGLVQVCYLMEGLSLLRDADIQYEDKRFTKVEPDKSLSESHFQAGDLLVFGSKTAVIHIGIASDDGRFIHASGRQANFGTYYNACSEKSWGEIYLGAVRLSEEADLSIESA